MITSLTPQGSFASVNPKGWDALGKIVGKGIKRARGHLLSRENGGSGDTIYNIVPLESTFNKSDMRKPEIAMAVARRRATVCFFIMPRYSGIRGDQGIPSSIKMLWVTSDGEVGHENPPHAPGNN